MSAIDAGGNMLFLFSVRRHERAEMTTVYSTYRDVADIVPPGLFSVLLRVFELPAVFVVGGAVTFALALLARRVHTRPRPEPEHVRHAHPGRYPSAPRAPSHHASGRG